MRYRLLAILVLGVFAMPSLAQRWIAQQEGLSAVLRFQGRVNCIAVSPLTDASFLVGTQSGGVFITRDGGARFQRINALPARNYDVAWLKPNPSFPADVMLATFARGWHRLPNHGGIWRSEDAGGSWRQVDLHGPLGLSADNDIEGYDIDQDTFTDKVAVATNKGIALTHDRGRAWKIFNPFEPESDPTSYSVSYSNRNILVAGTVGVRWSRDDGRTWNTPVTSLAGSNESNYNGLNWGSRSGMAYYADSAGNLFFTVDYGRNWTMIKSAPALDPNAGGNGFIYEEVRGGNLELYLSNRAWIYRLSVQAEGKRPTEISFEGIWNLLAMDHMDPRCMAFKNSGEPYVIGTDGGLQDTPDRGGSWKAAPRRGLEALQLYDVKGQWIGSGGSRVHDLYIGTQDNDLYASSDRGITWPGVRYGEGGFFGMLRDAGTGTPTIVHRNYSANLTFEASGRLFAGAVPGTSAATATDGTSDATSVFTTQPLMHSSGYLIQRIYVGSSVTTETLRTGLAVSNVARTSWTQYANFQEGTFDDGSGSRSVTVTGWSGMPVVSQSGRSVRVFHAYQGDWDPVIGDSTTYLLHVSRSPARFDEGSFELTPVVYPRMSGFGSLGRTSYQFVWAPVFDAHPYNRTGLIASDATTTWPNPRGGSDFTGGVSLSRDAGETWAIDRNLSYLVTWRGLYNFSIPGALTFVSAISYCPDDPNLILIGCRDGGVYISTNGGGDWEHVRGSNYMVNVSAFHWVSNTEAYVATFGTGLWRVFTVPNARLAHAFSRIDDSRTADAFVSSQHSVAAPATTSQRARANPCQIEFIGGKGDPRQPTYPGSAQIRVRLKGCSPPRSPKELQIRIDGRPVSDRQFTFVPSENEVRIVPPARGGHILSIRWTNNQIVSETGGTFFVGGSEARSNPPPKPPPPPNKTDPGERPSGSFMVLAAGLKADNPKMSGPCPITVKFGGYVTTNGPGQVRYTFTRNDGAKGPVYTLDFKAAGTQYVSTTWTFGGNGLESYEGWQAVKILSPNEFESNHQTGSFSIRCEGAAKPVGPGQGEKPAAQFAVTTAGLKADNPKMSGTCPITVKFGGYITTNGPGQVRYTFTRNDGAKGPVYTLEFKAAGTQYVDTTWTFGGKGLESYEGWQAVKILSPNQFESSHQTGSFSIRCEGAAGPVGPGQGEKPAGSFMATAAGLKADNPKMSGACPITVKFGGYITTNGPGQVRYTFTRNDGARGPVYTLEFKAAGTQYVDTTWTFGGKGLESYEGWQAVKVLSPNEFESSHQTGSFSIRCEGAAKP